LVSLLIGVNNQYRGRDVEEYRAQFGRLLELAIGLAGGTARHLLVLLIPDLGVTPFAAGRDAAAIAREIDAFNSVNAGEARRLGARYVDVTPISRLARDEPGLIAGEGLHPSGAMYGRGAGAAMEAACAALGMSDL